MRATKSVGVLVSAALLATSVSIVAGPARVASADPALSDRLVPTRPFQKPTVPDAASDHTDASWLAPTVTLPPVETVDVDVPAEGWARAGSLPVWIGPAEAGTVPTRVRVRMLTQVEVDAAGGRMLGFDIARSDGGSSVGSVAVRLDYSGVQRAFGGDFASRLRLVRVVDCVADASCEPPLVPAVNDTDAASLRAMTLPVRPDPLAEPTGTAPASDSGFGPQDGPGDELPSTPSPTRTLYDVLGDTTYVAASSVSGSNGDYAASNITGSDRWGVGIGSGAFTYTYPIKVPPAPAGPAPALSLDYNSQSVDGRTLAENGQASQVGEGWSLQPGFIERKFPTCGGTSAARLEKCWSPNNEYFLHFGGKSGELINKPGTNEWRLRGNDPAWRILSFTYPTGPNGDNDGEYFMVVTPDGTKYWFGFGFEPRNTPMLYTNSAQTVPVTGGSGEPCYNSVLSASWCQQAYRWNLDRVLDTNGNVTTLFYVKETNKYARNGTSSLTTAYDRASYLSRIEYGLRNGAENAQAPDQVRVTVADRCAAQTNCPAPSPSVQSSYPDVPLDLMCTATTCSSTLNQPSFWSTKQITSIRTEYWNLETTTPAYTPVTTYELSYSFPGTGDTTSPSLWLTQIQQIGEWSTGDVTDLPAVRLAGVNLRNRVFTSASAPPLNKWRVAAIRNELDAVINVTYDTPHPCPIAPSPSDNRTDCYPLWYDPQNGSGGSWVSFYKYLVTKTVLKDDSGGQPDRTTNYTYYDEPAWHYTDSLLASSESWSDYRGHADVGVKITGSGDSQGTNTRYAIFRGMNGDKITSTTSKSASLTDSSGATFTDAHYLAGMPLEERHYDASTVNVASTFHRYWVQQTIDGPNGYQSHDTQYVRESRTIDRTLNVDTGAWRSHQRDMTYNSTYGSLYDLSDLGNGGTADDTCTRYGITQNTSGSTGSDIMWILDRPWRTITYGGDCDAVSPPTLARTEFYYDNQAFTAAPTKGNATETWRYATLGTIAKTQTGYDSYGRVTSVKSPREVAAAGTGNVTTTSYSPSTGYPYDGITTTNAAGHATTTVPNPGFGTPRRIYDASGNVTYIYADGLGRATTLVRPGDTLTVPTARFTYVIRPGTPNRITTERLLSASTYVTTYTYLDGVGRVVQTQLPEPDGGTTNRRIVMTRYDAIGHKAAETQPFGADGSPGSNLAVVDLNQIPLETRYSYDALGRTKWTAQFALGVSKFSTSTTYHGWSHTVSAPVRSDVDYYTDVFGRTTKVIEYPTVGTATTNYGYTPLGDLETIADDAGNNTLYTYDWLRRRTYANDPDQSAWSTTYDLDGNVQTVTDAKSDKLWHGYDRIGRKTETRLGSATGTKLAGWTFYDGSTDAGRGLVKSASRWIGTDDPYVTTVTGYDNRNRATGKQWTIPTLAAPENAARNSLAGTYAYTFGYNKADSQTSVTLPAAGGLSAETVTTTFNAAGLRDAVTSSTNGNYLDRTFYYTDGRLLTENLPLTGGRVLARTYDYDPAAGRLQRLFAQTLDTTPVTYEDRNYAYDDANLVTVTDKATGGADERECFKYDPLNRLTRAYTTTLATACSVTTPPIAGPAPYDTTWNYNDIGNITSVVDNVAGTTKSYTYGLAGHAHAVGSIAGAAYGYDANGATTTRATSSGAQTIGWDELHQLRSITGPGASTFVYGADGARLVRSAGTTSTLYLDGMELTAAAPTGGATTVTAIRYYAGLALRTPTKRAVMLSDRQSSLSTVIDTATGTANRRRYTPYGAPRGGASLPDTDHGFLGKAEDATGLVATGARYYDTVIGRFASVDPLSAPLMPQTLNPYAYVSNSPPTLADPSGLFETDPDAGGGGSGCEDGCAPEDVIRQTHSHDEIYNTVVRNINAGVPTSDEVFKAGRFNRQERRQLIDAMSASPCSVATDRSDCHGNSHAIFQCQMSGGSDCAARAARMHDVGTSIGVLFLFMLSQRTSRSLDAAGAALDRAMVADMAGGRVVIGKVADLSTEGAVGPGERTLLPQLPDQGSARANWGQNSGVLRQEMARGVPIRDASVDPVTGALDKNTGFLRAERMLLQDHGWTYDPKTTLWLPPGG